MDMNFLNDIRQVFASVYIDKNQIHPLVYIFNIPYYNCQCGCFTNDNGFGHFFTKDELYALPTVYTHEIDEVRLFVNERHCDYFNDPNNPDICEVDIPVIFNSITMMAQEKENTETLSNYFLEIDIAKSIDQGKYVLKDVIL